MDVNARSDAKNANPADWADRFAPLITLWFAGLLLMAVEFAVGTASGAGPMTLDIYGPTVLMVDPIYWIAAQCAVAGAGILGGLFRGKLRALFFLMGGLGAVVLFAVFSQMASGTPDGSVLKSGSRWLAVPISTFAMIAGAAGLYVRR